MVSSEHKINVEGTELICFYEIFLQQQKWQPKMSFCLAMLSSQWKRSTFRVQHWEPVLFTSANIAKTRAMQVFLQYFCVTSSSSSKQIIFLGVHAVQAGVGGSEKMLGRGSRCNRLRSWILPQGEEIMLRWIHAIRELLRQEQRRLEL